MKRAIAPLFPGSILDGTDEDRLAYFRKKVIAHPHLAAAFNLAQDNIEYGADHEIVAVVGPAEVGTTTLAGRLYNHYRKEWPGLQGMGDDESMVGSVAVHAPSSAGRVDANYWKRLLKELLHKGGDILIDQKLFVIPSEFQLSQYTPYSAYGLQDLDALMSAVLSMLCRRNTKMVLINQAERLFPVNDKAGCIRSQQMLYDLAARTEARIVLIANYQLLQTTCTAGDWLQRRNIVHFRRYDRRDEEEQSDFNSVLDELLGHIPGPRRLDKLSEATAEALYVNSVGCVGTLKKTLTMAASHCHRTGEKMTEELLLTFCQPNVTAANLARQAVVGERLLTDVDQKAVERILDGGLMDEGTQNESIRPGQGGRAKNPDKRGHTFARHIGERTPSRDPVGGINAKRRA